MLEGRRAVGTDGGFQGRGCPEGKGRTTAGGKQRPGLLEASLGSAPCPRAASPWRWPGRGARTQLPDVLLRPRASPGIQTWTWGNHPGVTASRQAASQHRACWRNSCNLLISQRYQGLLRVTRDTGAVPALLPLVTGPGASSPPQGPEQGSGRSQLPPVLCSGCWGLHKDQTAR